MTNLKAFGLTVLLSAIVFAAMHWMGADNSMLITGPAGTF